MTSLSRFSLESKKKKKMSFGQSKSKPKKPNSVMWCLSILRDWSSNFKFTSLGFWRGVAVEFCYYGYCSACSFLFNNCTGTLNNKPCWDLSQSGPKVHTQFRVEQEQVGLAQETQFLTLLRANPRLNSHLLSFKTKQAPPPPKECSLRLAFIVLWFILMPAIDLYLRAS